MSPRALLVLLAGALAACADPAPAPSACPTGYPGSTTRATGCTPGPGWIAYAFIREGEAIPTLFISRADGSCAERITTDGAFYGAPAFFPGGTRLAYASTRSGLGSLYVLDLTTGLETGIDTQYDFGFPFGLATLAAAAPSVSPDGLTIAFEGSLPDPAYAGWSDVFSVPVAGGAVTRLTNDPAAATLPNWHQSGTPLYYLSYSTGTPELFSTVPDGTQVATPVTSGSGLSSKFTVSGDGTALLYGRFSSTGAGTKPTELVTFDLASSGIRVVSTANEADPAIDATDTQVAVSRRSETGYDLYLLDYATGAVKQQLTHCPGQAFGATFAR